MTEEQFQAKCRREYAKLTASEKRLFERFGYGKYVSMMRKELGVAEPERKDQERVPDFLQAGDAIITNSGSRIAIESIAEDRLTFRACGIEWKAYFATLEVLEASAKRVERNGEIIWINNNNAKQQQA